jgi:hypothetical protein
LIIERSLACHVGDICAGRCISRRFLSLTTLEAHWFIALRYAGQSLDVLALKLLRHPSLELVLSTALAVLEADVDDHGQSCKAEQCNRKDRSRQCESALASPSRQTNAEWG